METCKEPGRDRQKKTKNMQREKNPEKHTDK